MEQFGGSHPVFRATPDKKDVLGTADLVVKAEKARDQAARCAATENRIGAPRAEEVMQ